MKKTIEMMKAALMLLVVMMMGMTITSCSDDDDKSSDWPSKFTQSITVNGKSFTIDQAGYSEDSYEDVDYYIFSAYNEETDADFEIRIPKVHMGKKLDLTKDLRPSQDSPLTVDVNRTFAYGDGAFEAGSYLIATFDGSNLKLYAKGKALDAYNDPPSEIEKAPSKGKLFEPYTFEISFSGKVVKSEPK
jgi:hypothetical protein